METVKGYIDNITYRNETNGYTVLNLVKDDEELTLVGFFQHVDEGETIEAEGEYINHPVYGAQFKMTRYRAIPPEDMISLERYLGSGAIKGVGPALAARIVKTFGKDTFRVIDEEPELLERVKGISINKAREIAVQMEEKKEMREVMVYLQKYGISNTQAIKIYQRYRDKIYEILEENPYRLAEDINGIGFRIADEIATRVGIHTDSDYRIRSGILYTLLQATNQGHTYLPMAQLLRDAADTLGLNEEQIAPQVSNLCIDKKLVIKENNNEKSVYSISYYRVEEGCANILYSLNETLPVEEGLEEQIRLLERKYEVELDDLQRKAVVESIRNGLFILTGGPGTGKTTTINMMIHYFYDRGLDILLAAPTGRAAKRMTEATGYEAKTIHRLLELSGELEEDGKKASFGRNSDNPLEADVVIVDEMSMVDINLFYALLKAIMPGTRVIMVGDMNQLPSVGPGQVLKDLIHSNTISVISLKKIYRQSEKSFIVENAHRINQGLDISLDNKSSDFFFLERDNVQLIYKNLIQLIRDKLPPYVGASSYEIQVLTPTRQGLLGVEELNKILQQYLNPPSLQKKELETGNGLFRQGDKVMQIRNNYQIEWEIVNPKYGIPVDKGLGVFNGDIGCVLSINEFAKTITVEYEEHKRTVYPYTQLDELELAYAITIHKSQGSEYPAVVIPLLGGPQNLLNRNLLYTGVTRAKQCLTILGSRQTVKAMIENEHEQRRYSGLCDRIKELERIYQ